MIPLSDVDKFVDVLRELETGVISSESALQVLSSVIARNLDEFGVTANANNAGLIANLIFAQIAPTDPVSSIVGDRTLDQVSRDFSAVPASLFALERGVAVVVGCIETSFAPDLPKKGAKTLTTFIESSGYLPGDAEVSE